MSYLPETIMDSSNSFLQDNFNPFLNPGDEFLNNSLLPELPVNQASVGTSLKLELEPTLENENPINSTSANFDSLLGINETIPFTDSNTIVNGLKGEYYNNRDFTNLAFTRSDETIDFDWGNNSPDETIAADTFSVRWTGQIEAPTTETYKFYTTSDDGVRLWIDGELIVDNWTDHAPTENSGIIELEAGEKYDLRLDYYENKGGAVSNLAWSTPTIAKQIIPTEKLFNNVSQPTPPGKGKGLVGEYFDKSNFTNSVLTRIDETVNFDWDRGSPDNQIAEDTFSVRWSGKVQPRYDENYTFYTNSDDGVRLWVNGELLIDNWTVHPTTEDRGQITLEAGELYDLKLEYYENKIHSNIELLWSSASQLKEVVPTAQLYPILPESPATGTGEGLTAEYFDNTDFTDLAITRIDETVNFDWGRDAPDSSIETNTFSARWTGQVEPLYTDYYKFSTFADDGVKLWVDGALIIDDWTEHPTQESDGYIFLEAGQLYDLKLEYYENWGFSDIQLLWSSALQNQEIIPTSQLYSDPQIDLEGVYFNVFEEPLNYGDEFEAKFQVKNSRPGDAREFDVSFYLSENGKITSDSHLLGTYTIDSLAGKTTSEVLSVNLSLPDRQTLSSDGNTYTLGMIVDSGGDVVETNEENNANLGEYRDIDTVEIYPSRESESNPVYEFPQENQPLIGVIDTGFAFNNPDLDYNRIVPGSDFVDNDDNPFLGSREGNHHGSHVLGLIGATQNNNLGINGINDDAPLWVGRAVGSGDWAASLEEFVNYFAATGQTNGIVNLSLDLTQENPNGSITTRYELTPAERAALGKARQQGVLVVVAAGNDGEVMSVLGQASQEFDNLITVGAADGLERAAYSSYGLGLSLLAPGGTLDTPILSTVGDRLGTMAGTSVATAKVTGAASQVWAANPDLSYRQVIEALTSTAQDLQTSGWDEQTGAGLLDLEAAIALAQQMTGETYNPTEFLIPISWDGEGVLTPSERAVQTVTSPFYTDPLTGRTEYKGWLNSENPTDEYHFTLDDTRRLQFSFDALNGSAVLTGNGVNVPAQLTQFVEKELLYVDAGYLNKGNYTLTVSKGSQEVDPYQLIMNFITSGDTPTAYKVDLPRVDLVGDNLSITSGNLSAGDSFNVNLQLANTESSNASDFRVSFYLSTDSNITDTDHLLDSEFVLSLEGDQTKTITQQLTLPDANDQFWSDQETYYIGAIIDDLSEVAETNPNNNKIYQQISIEPGFPVKDPILPLYKQNPWLGNATEEVYIDDNGFYRQQFENGYIVWNGEQAAAYREGKGISVGDGLLGVAIFEDFPLLEVTVDGNLEIHKLDPFGTQDEVGSLEVSDGGSTLTLTGNTWKQIPIGYDLKFNSVLKFDYQSSFEGELQGIGFDNNEDITDESGKLFKLFGTQIWENNVFDDYSGSDWKTYEIPVGMYLTGYHEYLVFANDQDEGDLAANSSFRNIQLYENDEVLDLRDENSNGWNAEIFHWDEQVDGEITPGIVYATKEGGEVYPNFVAKFNLDGTDKNENGLTVDWGTNSPNNNPLLPHDNFVLKTFTEAKLNPGETYEFEARGDDKFRILVRPINEPDEWLHVTPSAALQNGSLAWQEVYGESQKYEFNVPEDSGEDFMVVAYLYEGSGDANFELSWKEKNFLHDNPEVSNPLRGFKSPIGVPIGQDGWKITQYPGGTYSHGGTYAIDLSIAGDQDRGKPVFAMLSGTVVDIVQQHPDTGGGKANNANTNKVVIEHENGYFSRYLHLQQNFNSQVDLKVGQKVNAGDLIGLVGNSGWSSGYHLHVDVGQIIGGGFVTKPFEIEGVFSFR
ncbi:MAG: PA14 domain-containing protein [Oscillatoria sp. PMC 1068.18]|nr:PA14 domain-containing protein [Oscillatoria sp. PMC 1076.18]MEC4988492.1 PA14 domain-containing protein [Oscillatoria sp. PMC 1068.18]